MSRYAGQCKVCGEWIEAGSMQAHTKLAHPKPKPKVWTLTELYGWFTPMAGNRDDRWDFPRPCHVCGAAVLKPDAHLSWHNKKEREDAK